MKNSNICLVLVAYVIYLRQITYLLHVVCDLEFPLFIDLAASSARYSMRSIRQMPHRLISIYLLAFCIKLLTIGYLVPRKTLMAGVVCRAFRVVG